MTVVEVYQQLYDRYGPQGWWPVYSNPGRLTAHDVAAGDETNLPRPGGYHPGDYTVPDGDPQRYEICIGAILTQNTAWLNVEKVIFRLIEARVLRPERILNLGMTALAELIRPAGYFNVKARKLREFTEFYRSLSGRTPSRDELLAVWGIGAETADSMLLYAYGVPTMVVDAYTRRVFANFAITDGEADYTTLKQLCEAELEPDVVVYQEFHALLVAHGKQMKHSTCR